MPSQLVTRVGDDLAAEVDALVTNGVVASRSAAVRSPNGSGPADPAGSAQLCGALRAVTDC